MLISARVAAQVCAFLADGKFTTVEFDLPNIMAFKRQKVKELIKNFQILGALPVSPGKRVQLCYTTEGAEAVALQPPVKDKLTPGANRCFTVAPDKTTTYILSATATDAGPRSSSVRTR